MEVAARENCRFVRVFEEDEWVICGAVELDLEDSASFGEGVKKSAMDLRDTAEAVGVLDLLHDRASSLPLCAWNGGAFEELQEMRCAVDLAEVGAGEMEARVEGGGSATEGFHREGGCGLGGVEEGLERGELEAAEGEHGLGAVEQRDAFLGLKREGRETSGGETLGGGEDSAVVVGEAFADEDEGHVGEGGEVAAGSDAAARRNDGRDVVIEKVADTLSDDGTNAGEALGEDVGADEHHAANDGSWERFADAAAVGADEVDLHLLDFVVVEADVGEEADAGIERVDGSGATHGRFDGLAGAGHAFNSERRELDSLSTGGNGNYVFYGEALAIQNGHDRRVARSGREENTSFTVLHYAKDEINGY